MIFGELRLHLPTRRQSLPPFARQLQRDLLSFASPYGRSVGIVRCKTAPIPRGRAGRYRKPSWRRWRKKPRINNGGYRDILASIRAALSRVEAGSSRDRLLWGVWGARHRYRCGRGRGTRTPGATPWVVPNASGPGETATNNGMIAPLLYHAAKSEQAYHA